MNSLSKWTRPIRRYLARKIYSGNDRELLEKRAALDREKERQQIAAIHSCEDLLSTAAAAAAEGRHYDAVRRLRLAFLCDPEKTRTFCRDHPLAAVRQDGLVAESAAGIREKPRRFHLLRECGLLGRFGEKLTAPQREIIRRAIESHQEAWDAGRTPRPALTDIAQTAGQHEPGGEKALVVMSQYIHNDPAYVDNDISYHFQLSAREAGFEVEHFPADRITYQGSDDPAPELARLEKLILEKKPSMVIFDGNFVPGPRTIGPDFFLALKKRHPFFLVSVIGDWYPFLKVDFFAHWSSVTDLAVAFHRHSLYHDATDPRRVLVWPTLPYATTAFRGPDPVGRDLGLTYIGSDSRDRGLMVDLAQRSTIPTYCRIHQRLRKDAPDHSQLADIFGRSRLILNNGWLDNGEDIITGRVGETVLSGALLLQEVGSPLDDYLSPFVHYAPFSNLHQFVALAQFFLEEEDLRHRIARQAHAFWTEHYSHVLFWKMVLERRSLAAR